MRNSVNHAKVTGMAGIWSDALTLRQLWAGGRKSRSGEWEIYGSLPAATLMTHPHAHTCAHLHTKLIGTYVKNTHTHTRKSIKSDLQQLKDSAVTQGLCPQFQEAKTGQMES